MRLVFCQSAAIEGWLGVEVANTAERPLDDRVRAEYEMAHRYLDTLRSDEGRLACTIESACHLVTRYYKHSPPFRGEVSGFSLRRNLARAAMNVIRQHVELLTPLRSHFEKAEALFYAQCVREVKEAFAGFGDYVEAALVIQPQPKHEIMNIAVVHNHLPYILHKEDWGGTTHHI